LIQEICKPRCNRRPSLEKIFQIDPYQKAAFRDYLYFGRRPAEWALPGTSTIPEVIP
jgi:hypothetical protein